MFAVQNGLGNVQQERGATVRHPSQLSAHAFTGWKSRHGTGSPVSASERYLTRKEYIYFNARVNGVSRLGLLQFLY